MHGRPARLYFKIINASHNRPSPRVPEQRELALFPPPTPPRAAPRRLVVRCCRGPIRHPLPPSLSLLSSLGNRFARQLHASSSSYSSSSPLPPVNPDIRCDFAAVPFQSCGEESLSLSVSLWCKTDILGGGRRGSKLSFLIRLGRIVGVFDRA